MRPLLASLAATLLVACQNYPPAALEPRMKDHARQSAAIQDAIAKGDLERAKREAAILAALPHEAAITTPWNGKLDAMTAAAWRVAGSANLPAATANFAALQNTCSNCHASIPAAGPGDSPAPAQSAQ
jgi:hypothetical protein